MPTALGDAVHRFHSGALKLAMEDAGWSCALDDCFFHPLILLFIFPNHLGKTLKSFSKIKTGAGIRVR